jgi:hypothetical protein
MTTTLAPETLDASGLHFSEFNERIRAAIKAGAEELTLTNVNGQRYIGPVCKPKLILKSMEPRATIWEFSWTARASGSMPMRRTAWPIR